MCERIDERGREWTKNICKKINKKEREMNVQDGGF